MNARSLQAAAYFLRNQETEVSLDQMNSKKRGPKSRLGEFMPRDEEDPAASSDQDMSLEWKAEEWSKCSQTCGSQGKG